MKKIIILLFAFLLTLILHSAVMASTIAVNVEPGFTIDLNKQLDPSSDPLTLTGQLGVNEKLYFEASYTNSDPIDTTFGIRYVFINNMALTLNYETQTDYNFTGIGFRYKNSLNDKLDLVGVLDYYSGSGDVSGYNLTGQAEYKVAEFFTANVGFIYYNPKGDSSTTSILAGGEFYPTENWCPYFDYEKPTDGDGTLSTGVSYTF